MVQSKNQGLIFLVLGDIHGQLNKAARLLREVESDSGVQIDFVLQVGDFGAHRHQQDLFTMYAPFREKRMGDFFHYLNRDKQFPWPLYFIGGNHESYGFLEKHPKGKTIAANINYLGRAGMLNIRGLKVAYLTGIYNHQFYHDKRENQEQLPGNDDLTGQLKLSCYRKEEVSILYDGVRPHVLLVHEWPHGLVRPKDHETGEPGHRKLRYSETGVPIIREIIEKTGSDLAVCGHLHRRYSGKINNALGGQTLVHCLGHIESGNEAWSLFVFDGGRVKEYIT